MEHVVVKAVTNQGVGMVTISNILIVAVEFNLFQSVV